VPESLPLFDPPDFPEALAFVSSPEKGGGAPGCSALDGSDVVVVDLTTVELVASTRVVDVVLLVAALVVVVVDALTVAVVEETSVVVVVAATGETTTTPVMPCPTWILQW
jgi:hypothetical protein